MANMDFDTHTVLTNKIKQLVSEKLNVDAPSIDTKLIEEGYLDSLLFIDLLMALEQEFSIVIELDRVDFDNFATINAIADFVGTELGSD